MLLISQFMNGWWDSIFTSLKQFVYCIEALNLELWPESLHADLMLIHNSEMLVRDNARWILILFHFSKICWNLCCLYDTEY